MATQSSNNYARRDLFHKIQNDWIEFYETPTKGLIKLCGKYNIPLLEVCEAIGISKTRYFKKYPRVHDRYIRRPSEQTEVSSEY